MAIDLEGLSARELQALIAKANQRKKALAKRKPVAAVQSPAKGSSRKGATIPPKYRHPDTGATWAGRGMAPKWLAAELAKGRKLEDFLIDAG